MLLLVLIHSAVLNFCLANSAPNYLVRKKRSDDFIPCENGWYYFNEKCYKIGGKLASDRLNWEDAAKRCKSSGGDLVSIQSKEEQDFIVAFLQLDAKFYTYIGLHDRDVEGEYKWNDGSIVNYTNWAEHEPAGRGEEDCGQLVYEPQKDLVGKWNDNPCGFPDAYICKMDKSTKMKSPNRMYCSSEEGGGWKYQDSCYHVVTEMKSWDNAEKHCKDNYNGHLVTILDTTVDMFLEYILSNIKKELWIGIKVKNQSQQKWSSGWFVSYDGFNKEQGDFVEGSCVLRKKRKEWIMSLCSKKYSFICETTKVSPPVLQSPAIGSHCPQDLDDWRDLGGEYCYYIEKEKHLNWYEASFDCKRRGGNLVSLHSMKENYILHPFVRYTQQGSYGEQTVFIGLYRLLANEEFAWSDGSVKDYENWRHEEPNNVVEKCVEVSTHDMKWNDCNCDYKRGYICSVKKIPPNSTANVDETTDYAAAPSTTPAEEIAQCTGLVSVNVLIGVSVAFLLVTLLLGVAVYFFRYSGINHQSMSTAVSRAPPFPPRNQERYSNALELTVKDDEIYEMMK